MQLLDAMKFVLADFRDEIPHDKKLCADVSLQFAEYAALIKFMELHTQHRADENLLDKDKIQDEEKFLEWYWCENKVKSLEILERCAKCGASRTRRIAKDARWVQPKPDDSKGKVESPPPEDHWFYKTAKLVADTVSTRWGALCFICVCLTLLLLAGVINLGEVMQVVEESRQGGLRAEIPK